jgi:predicted metal-dependent hydrolase
LTATRPFEAPAVADLPGGPVPFTLRQSPRARSLRVVIHPERGVVVTVPANRAGRTDGERRAVQFLGERERWVRRHLDRNARVRAELAARGGPRDGGQVRYLGELHRVAVTAAPVGARRSTVERLGDDLGDSLLIRRAARERRTDAALLEAWLRERARTAIDRAVARHAAAMGVAPGRVTLRDPRSRWGSASRTGTLSLSWRLVLAPPEALETVVVHELAHLRIFGHGPRFWAFVAEARPDHATWRRWLHDHATELHGTLD